ncbi:MAG TPA: PA14 domain-containing protein, partial [Polyangiales bacterium]
PRLARDAYMSCASCHNDGGQDGRVWDLTGLGEGLRNTSSLRGRAGRMGRLHWSANFDEVQDFEDQIRALAQGTGLMTDAQLFTGTRTSSLGDPKAGVSADLDALAAYLGSLTTFEPSPFRASGGALTSDAVSGRTLFAARCASCHIGNDFSDSVSLSTRNVGTLKPSSGKRLNGALSGLDTPTLRDVTSTPPYLHDGSAASIEAAIQAHTGIALSATELAQVAAFTRQIGSEEAAVAPTVSAGAGLRGQYFPNNALSGTPTASRTEAINFSWGSAAPISGIPADNFSARWTGHLLAPSSGNYRFQTVSQDGVRVWVNGVRVVNNWTAHSFSTTDTSGDVALTAGQRYEVIVEYFERTGSATMRFNWRVPGTSSYVAVPAAQLYAPGTGLTGQYFASADLTGPVALTRSETINFDWTTGSPAANVPVDNFSVRWSGKLAPLTSGNYRLQTNSDDGVRVWLNNTLIIDNWTAHAPTLDASPVLSLVSGQRYDLRVEYNEFGGGAVMQLTWQPPGATAFASVPVSQLYAP